MSHLDYSLTLFQFTLRAPEGRPKSPGRRDEPAWLPFLRRLRAKRRASQQPEPSPRGALPNGEAPKAPRPGVPVIPPRPGLK